MTAPETPVAAPSGPARIPFVTDAMRLVRVLVSPTAVFEEQREQPTFWIPWLIVSVLMVGVTMLSFPYSLAVAKLGAAAKGQPFPAAAEGIMRFSSVVAVPVVMLIVLLATAGVMYVVLLASGSEARYKGLLTVAVFTGLLAVIQLLGIFLVLKLRDQSTLVTAADYQVSFGLDLLLPQDTTVPKFLEGLLRGISPVSIWGLVITAFGVRAMERTSKGAAWAAAGTSFALGLLIGGVGAMMAPR